MILRKTKFKVTFWYVITVALTLLIFSGIFYFLTLSISERAIDRHQRRIDMAFELNSDPGPGKGPGAQRSNAQLALDQAKQEGLKQLQKSLFIEIVALDIVIILITAFFGYYIAGKSLSPVEVMIEKQKDFVSNAAHELKTPLTAMKAELEVAMRDKRLTRAEISEVFSSTIEEINRLAALIGAFLNQSKYEKLNAATYKLTSLNSIVENVVAKNFILANSKRISVEMDLQDIDVKCDRASIYELVSVLLDNAIKYAF
ncbi:MAG TPA: histidine kinase dimerization/phospho-acceptor domain-containing protein, partial [bacterium]|nr:histidine kinase dimerization/phospho-acceptor domain-containing protein [bacterium]